MPKIIIMQFLEFKEGWLIQPKFPLKVNRAQLCFMKDSHVHAHSPQSNVECKHTYHCFVVGFTFEK